MGQSSDDLLQNDSFVALGGRILTGRTALFLGAGSSLGSQAPTTSELSRLIGRNVLHTELEYPLADMVDFADGGPGRRAVNQEIVQALRSLEPSESLTQLAALPWTEVFSVNFDDLFEKALAALGLDANVYISPQNFDRPSSHGTPLYMLHGSIKAPNDPDMGLVLTQDDISRAAHKRASFYHQLINSLLDREIIYIGFSLTDSDFRRIIGEVNDSVDNRQNLIPRGYAVFPDPPPFAVDFWDTKKISIVDSTMENFVEALATLRRGKTVQPITVGSEPRLPRFLANMDPTSVDAEEMEWAFDFPELDDGQPNANTFLRGAPPNWAAIRERVDAERDIADNFLEDILIDPSEEPPSGNRRATIFALLSGYAGSGKTTLAKRLAWQLAHSWGRPVLWAREPARLHLDLIENAVTQAKQRVYVFIDDASEAGLSVVELLSRSKRRGLPVTYVVADRLNEWTAATQASPVVPEIEHEMSRLSNREVSSLLDRLEQTQELGVLASLPREQQHKRFVERAGRHLLVLLREVTEGRAFDDIIESELTGIPRLSARRAYITVCTLFQFDVPIRAGVLSRTTGVAFPDFAELILRPASRIIIDHQRSTREEPTYTARHSVIARVVFRRALRSSSERAEEITRLLRHLDYGYREDRRAFGRLISARWLKQVGVDVEDQAAIYSLARELRPGDASVIQQEGLSHRNQNPDRAAQLLREAHDLAPRDESIQHSQAMLLLDQARNEDDVRRQSRLFAVSEERLRGLIRSNRDNSAAHVGLATLYLRRSQVVDGVEQKLELLAEAERTIDQAFRRGNPTPQVFEMSAKISEEAGHIGAAMDDFERAAAGAADQPAFWLTFSRFAERHNGPAAAVEVLNRGIDLHPIDPLLNYELALALERIDQHDDEAIRTAYRIAIAEPVRGHLPELDYAIYLHRTGKTQEAEGHFAALRREEIPYGIKSRPRRWIEESSGSRIAFDAEVREVRSRYVLLTIPNLDGQVYLSEADAGNRRWSTGMMVQVEVFYNAFGLRAVLA